MLFLRRLSLPVVLLLGFLLLPASLPGALFAQSTESLLDTPACRDNPHSEACICAEVRKFGFFPEKFEPLGGVIVAQDADGDGFRPTRTPEGLWVDDPSEDDPNDPDDDPTDLQFAADDRYNERCALSYFRENQRRLWVFAVAVGAAFTVFSLIWVGVTYMQHAASGIELSRARAILTRVLIGLVILSCALLVWEGVSAVLFPGMDFWTQDRGVFYDLK